MMPGHAGAANSTAERLTGVPCLQQPDVAGQHYVTPRIELKVEQHGRGIKHGLGVHVQDPLSLAGWGILEEFEHSRCTAELVPLRHEELYEAQLARGEMCDAAFGM